MSLPQRSISMPPILDSSEEPTLPVRRAIGIPLLSSPRSRSSSPRDHNDHSGSPRTPGSVSPRLLPPIRASVPSPRPSPRSTMSDPTNLAAAKIRASEALKLFMSETEAEAAMLADRTVSEPLKRLVVVADNFLRTLEPRAAIVACQAMLRGSKPSQQVKEAILKLLYIAAELSRLEEFIEESRPPRPRSGEKVSRITIDAGTRNSPRPSTAGSPLRHEDSAKQVTCRICETLVSESIFEEHSGYCERTQKLKLDLSHCDRSLADVAATARDFHDSQFTTLAEIVSDAALAQANQQGLPQCTKGIKAVDSLIQAAKSAELIELGKMAIDLVRAKAKLISRLASAIKKNPVHYNPRAPKAPIASPKDFEVLKLITRGGYGNIYLARKRATGDLYAIKVLKKRDMMKKNEVEHAMTELEILTSTHNPFVVNMYYSFQSKDYLYIVMEFYPGGDCFSLLQNLGCFSEEQARFYTAELVLAIEALHRQGTIHRDIKPDNMLIARDGHIKLTDFGLSSIGLIITKDTRDTSASRSPVSHHKRSESNGEKGVGSGHNSGNDSPVGSPRRREQNTETTGTPDYLAPEILLGVGHDFEVDWWALGCVLYEFVIGVPPFSGDSVQEIFQRILARDLRWDDVEISPEAKDLIEQLLEVNPEDRLGARGVEEIQSHPFFRGVDWENLLDQPAPFVPNQDGHTDTSYFDVREKFYPLEERDREQLKEFENDIAITQDPTFGHFLHTDVEGLGQKNLVVLQARRSSALQETLQHGGNGSPRSTGTMSKTNGGH
eukprot:TRINITY_DN5763_c0_g2_i1.p1 TRINITY_DN5763_c0_g2~~TRINITY_DN5763_c0_g2_i1.p1  ORF type:complete len:780 (-),score=200.09 TRINITY_DN5763_c0_g2_i1:64-2403(-)